MRRRPVGLERRDAIGSTRLRTWPHGVAADGATTACGETIAGRVRAFRRWTRREGVALPAFDERTTAGVGRMGPEYTALTLPPTALGVWRDGILDWVARCVDGGPRVVRVRIRVEQKRHPYSRAGRRR